MPNGGVMPSCFICSKAQKQGQAETDDERLAQLQKPYRCTFHGFEVPHPMTYVCAELSVAYKNDAIAEFAVRNGLEGGWLYEWLTSSHPSALNPQIPEYQHVLEPVDHIEVVRAWSEEDFARRTRDGNARLSGAE